jgi:hypothetical protein
MASSSRKQVLRRFVRGAGVDELARGRRASAASSSLASFAATSALSARTSTPSPAPARSKSSPGPFAWRRYFQRGCDQRDLELRARAVELGGPAVSSASRAGRRAENVLALALAAECGERGLVEPREQRRHQVHERDELRSTPRLRRR